MKSRNPDEIRNLIRNLSDFEISYAKPARYWPLDLNLVSSWSCSVKDLARSEVLIRSEVVGVAKVANN